MIDIALIRNAPDEIIRQYARRGFAVSFDDLLSWDARRRALIAENDAHKKRRNDASAEIPKLKRAGVDVAALIAEMKALGDTIAQNDADIAAAEERVSGFMSRLPNLPGEGIPDGGKENNRVVRVHGQKPVFDFTPLSHIDLCAKLGLIDYERGVRMGGSGFWVYRGEGARLEWAMLQYFIDEHLRDGYEMVFVPHLLNYESGYAAGQFPKFEDDVFWVSEEDGVRRRFILPTAETALVNLHRGEILSEDDLPRKYIAFTPCYRREAGSYRAEERGMIRGHQFNKVEMFQYTKPEASAFAHEELLGKAEALLKGLELHFQTVQLAAGDVSDAMSYTWDPEIWIPSMGIYKEASSVSNAGDYQARRGNIRYRNAQTGHTEFVHTLNGSGLATSRLLPAIIEQHQRADGTVRVPEALQPYFGKGTITGSR